ncbi:hypothetical protein [Streptomyces sp. UG1]|uniref:hypothetical protein n=1 Tax=Streptomyces sp. UG1 TaxID=3417652 RepID=UPI003CF0F7BF
MGAHGSHQLSKVAGATINTSGMIEPFACVIVDALALFAAMSGSRPPRKVTADPARTADRPEPGALRPAPPEA